MLDFSQLADSLAKKARQPDIHGYKPQEQQKPFHKSKKQQRLILGGNRSGKTKASCAEMIYWATGTHPYRETPRPPLKLRHVGVDRPNSIEKVLKETYKELCPDSYLRGGSFEKAWAKEPPVLHFSNESTIEFLSYEQDLDKHSGTSRHAIAFDEEPDEAILNENLARLIDTDGDWWIALTPLEGLSHLYFNYYEPYLNGSLPDDVEIFTFNSADNPYLPEGSLDRLLANLSQEEKDARKTGKFIALSGLIYPMFDINKHVIEIPPRPNMITFTSMDHGLRNPTSWHWYQVDHDGVVFIVNEHYAAEMLIKEHAETVKGLELSNKLLKPAYRVGDPSIANRNPLTGQSVQTEYAANKVFIGLGNNDVDVGINRVCQMFNEDRLFIDPSCRELIKELRKYRWAEWSSRKAATKNEAKAKPTKRHDHAVDDLRYAVMSRIVEDPGAAKPEPDKPSEPPTPVVPPPKIARAPLRKREEEYWETYVDYETTQSLDGYLDY